MALLFMDSFDHYVTADLLEKWSSLTQSDSGTVVISAANGRRSSASLRSNYGGGFCEAFARGNVAASGATAIFGVAVRTDATPGTQPVTIAAIYDGSTRQLSINLKPDLKLEVRRGEQNGTILGTTTAGIVLNAYSYIEVKILIDPTVGTVDVRIDGASALSLTGQNTRTTANSAWTAVMLGIDCARIAGTAGSPHYVDYDDLYVQDGSGAAPWNNFLGDVRVDVRNPTGAGGVTQWTPSTGSNYQNVDDTAPDDDTTYNTAASSALTDTFVCQDAPVAGAAIYGVQVNLSAKKTDSGTCSLASVVRQSSTNQVATAQNPGTSYSFLRTVYQVNPHTSAQWTESEFNNSEIGYQRTA